MTQNGWWRAIPIATMSSVILYYTSVAHSIAVRKGIERDAHKIEHTSIDISLDENVDDKVKMKEASGSAQLPQIHRGIFYIVGSEQADEFNETGEFKKFLGGDEDPPANPLLKSAKS